MKTLLSRVFRRDSRPRRAARPIRRNPGLRLETLDDRIVPAVTATLDGTDLSILGDFRNDTVTVGTFRRGTTTYVKVEGNFADGTALHSYALAGVKHLEFVSGGGVDSFTNNTGISASFNGGGGQVTMTGGTGKNVFFAGGDDTIIPRGSNNTTFGLISNPTAANLEAQGSLSAMVTNGMLWLAGPGGVGFKIAGNWHTDGAANETFTASGKLTLQSALGNISFTVPDAAPLTIHTANDDLFRAGVVTGVSLTGLPDLSVNGTGPLKKLNDVMGLNLNLPNIGWGLNLGGDPTMADMGVPLNAGVPYFYAKISNSFSGQFGNTSIGIGNGKSLAIAVDPADPSVAIHYGGGDVVSDVVIAGSVKGRIPFTPAAQPNAITDTLYGNLFAQASVDLGEYPIQITGGIIMNVDVNHTGIFGLSGDTFSKLMHKQMKVTDLAANVLNDIAIGVNGTASVTFEKAGFNFTVPVVNSTLIYEPGLVAFRGEQPNLFAKTPLESLLPTSLQDSVTGARFSVDGSIAWNGFGPTDWHLTGSVDNLVLGGGFRAQHAKITLDNNGVHADATITGLVGLANIHATGDIGTDGGFDLRVSSTSSFTIPSITTLHGTFDFELNHPANKGTTLSAHLTGGVDPFSVAVGDVGASVDATVNFTATTAIVGGLKLFGVKIDGSGTAGVYYTPNGGSKQTYAIGFNLDNSGFTIVTPSILPNLSVSWNGVVYDDLNADGVQETNEPGLAGYKVYLDLNNNGRLDLKEPTAISDASGRYNFSQLPVRPFTPRIVLSHRNIELTDEVDNDVFNPLVPGNMQYHFGLHAVNAAGQQQLANTLRQQLAHQVAGVDFWTGKKGQALINAVNGGSGSTQLAGWLAATLPNLAGASAGAHDLTGKTNADVAALMKQLRAKDRLVEAQVMATALSVYVTDSTQAGDTAKAYGFQIIGGGLATMSISIGNHGAALVGVNGSVMSILDILRATDARSTGGIASGRNLQLRGMTYDLYADINLAGRI